MWSMIPSNRVHLAAQEEEPSQLFVMVLAQKQKYCQLCALAINPSFNY